MDAGFSDAENLGFSDFWKVYDDHYELLNEAAMTEALADADFGPIVRQMPAELLKTQQDESRQRLRRAVEGDWREYTSNLRMQGGMYAKMGVSYESWRRLIRAVTRALTPLLVVAYDADPTRLQNAVLAMQAFFDWNMAIISDAYFAAEKAAIREREEDLAITLNSIGDAVIATDAEGRITKMNPVAERLTGWGVVEARGRRLPEVFHIINQYTRAAVENPAERVLREGVVVGLANHTLLVARDGTERPIADSGAPIRGEDQVLRGVVLVFRDMTEQHEVAAALQRSESRFAKLVQCGALAVMVLSPTGQFLEVNDRWLQMVGLTREQFESRLYARSDVTPAEWWAQDEAATRALNERGVFQPYEKEYLRPDGSRVPVLLGGAALSDGQWIAFALDISKQKQLEEFRSRSIRLEVENKKIQETSRLKSEFLANMSHELRTPLNAIIGFTELLHDGQVRPEMPEYQEFLGDILASGKHLLQLINDILDLSKVEAGKLEFHPERLDLPTLIGEVIAILRTIAAEKRIFIETAIQPDLGELVLDGSRLKQVLYNYVSNAIKFTPQGGRVVIKAGADGAGAFRLEVQDTGIGIAPDDLQRLFSEFQQLSAGAAKNHGGTGLGLALTKRLVEAQGGTVGVISEPNKGSNFFAVIPRKSLGGSPLPIPRQISGPTALAPCVLVIEDNERDQALIVRTLAEAGFAVEAVATAAQAVERCQNRQFDAITLDLLLPDASGIDALRAVRATPLNQNVPVIVITVVAERGAVGGHQVHDILPKPLDETALLRSMERAGVKPDQSEVILVVEDDPSSLRLMVAALKQLGYSAVGFSSPINALGHAEGCAPRAVILDLMLPELDGFQFLEHFRALPNCKRVPVALWSAKDLDSAQREWLESRTQAFLKKGAELPGGLIATLREAIPALTGGNGRDIREVVETP
jgi:PAS domain S-box-containing protein